MITNTSCFPRHILVLILLVSLFPFSGLAQKKEKEKAEPNTLTPEEQAKSWKLLFDGKTMNGWRGAYMDSLPTKGWEVRKGMLIVKESGGGEASFGGDIVTLDEYSNFDLTFEFKLTEGANSGVKYFVIEALPKTPGSAKGLEYQVLDDAKHPDAKLGINGNRTCASLYDLIPAMKKKMKPIGKWNRGRIVVNGKHVEHWLNGKKVLQYERGGKQFLAHKAESKFRDITGFGEYEKGRILIQDHGNRVFYRNIKIRTF
jgi:hypothetical protein